MPQPYMAEKELHRNLLLQKRISENPLEDHFHDAYANKFLIHWFYGRSSIQRLVIVSYSHSKLNKSD